jgi:hypothetical protein
MLIMKKIIQLLAIGLLLNSSCTTPELLSVPREEKLFGIDFTKYTAQGFLITPEKFIGSYESIGLITYEYLPAGVNKEARFVSNTYDDVRNHTNIDKVWVFEDVKIEQVMDSVYKISKNMGADALVNFEIRAKSSSVGTNASNMATRYGYTISGFAIKRK